MCGSAPPLRGRFAASMATKSALKRTSTRCLQRRRHFGRHIGDSNTGGIVFILVNQVAGDVGQHVGTAVWVSRRNGLKRHRVALVELPTGKQSPSQVLLENGIWYQTYSLAQDALAQSRFSQQRGRSIFFPEMPSQHFL